MTKAELLGRVVSLGALTRHDGEIVVDTLFGSLVGAIQSGDKVEIRGFGSFRTRQRKARIGRNPKTGEKVDVPAKKFHSLNRVRNFATWSTPLASSCLPVKQARTDHQTATFDLNIPDWPVIQSVDGLWNDGGRDVDVIPGRHYMHLHLGQ